VLPGREPMLLVATPTTSRTPGGDWAELEARWRRWRRRWWIRSVPNVLSNITLAPRDDVVGVADTVVPNYWVINVIAGYPQGLPWAPGFWAKGPFVGMGGTRTQPQTGQTQPARHQHGRC
jgi:hypothetical protein